MENTLGLDNTVYFEFSDFMREVGMMNIFLLRPLGLISSPSGIFGPDQYQELLEFCEEFPQYHIISSMKDGMFINHARTDAALYYLADGNPNPRLICKCHLLDVWFTVAE